MTLGDQWVLGYRLTFADEEILLILDELEDYSPHRPSHHNEYQRVWVEIFNREGQSFGEGWTYRMDANRVQRHQGRLVDSGEWQEAQ
jgi:gamma-glutamylcyclotransferase (GGCT)/AIG2-like uncharacterized protein YtfP